MPSSRYSQNRIFLIQSLLGWKLCIRSGFNLCEIRTHSGSQMVNLHKKVIEPFDDRGKRKYNSWKMQYNLNMKNQNSQRFLDGRVCINSGDNEHKSLNPLVKRGKRNINPWKMQNNQNLQQFLNSEFAWYRKQKTLHQQSDRCENRAQQSKLLIDQNRPLQTQHQFQMALMLLTSHLMIVIQ